MSSTRLRWIFLTPFLALAACTQFPVLDSAVTPQMEAAPFPDLVPIDRLVTRAEHGSIDPEATQAELSARLSALRARAARLRGTVLTGRERQRLAEGLQ